MKKCGRKSENNFLSGTEKRNRRRTAVRRVVFFPTNESFSSSNTYIPDEFVKTKLVERKNLLC